MISLKGWRGSRCPASITVRLRAPAAPHHPLLGGGGGAVDSPPPFSSHPLQPEVVENVSVIRLDTIAAETWLLRGQAGSRDQAGSIYLIQDCEPAQGQRSHPDTTTTGRSLSGPLPRSGGVVPLIATDRCGGAVSPPSALRHQPISWQCLHWPPPLTAH